MRKFFWSMPADAEKGEKTNELLRVGIEEMAWLFNKWSYRCYVLGFLLALSMAAVYLGFGESAESLSNALTFVCLSLFALGFSLWAPFQVRKIYVAVVGKNVIVLLHGLVLLISIVPARYLVAQGLGLPPQDFDLTVAIFALILYLPVWLLVAGVLMLSFYVVSLIVAGCLHAAERFISVLVSPFFQVFARDKCSSHKALAKRLAKAGNAGLGHAVGAAAISIVMVSGWEWSFAGLRSVSQPVVRFVAYFADFQKLYNYPGIDHSKRARLLENGVVSYAVRRGFNVSVEVEVLQQ